MGLNVILLAVDNDIQFLTSVSVCLTSQNIKIVLATNYTDAITYFKSKKPNIVLLDYQLKGDSRTGVDLALEMKNLDPSSKFILLSGVAQDELKNKDIFLKIFKKPILIKDLTEYMHTLKI